MTQLIHKSLAVFMAAIVLLTTMSFTVDMHYCGNTMVDFSIFHNADTCGMEKSELTSTCGSPEVSRKSCCSNEQLIIEGQDNLKDSLVSLTYEQEVFIASFIIAYVNRFEGFDKETTSFQEYKPPLVIRQLYKIDETYLI